MAEIIELGDRAKDSITGYVGIVTSIHSYLWACRRIAITSEKLSKDGIPQEAQSFDEPQVVLIKKAVTGPAIREQKPAPHKTGGPRRYEPTRV